MDRVVTYFYLLFSPIYPDRDESKSPYHSDFPANPDAELEPQSPANQSDLSLEPALDDSSLAESPTARQNLSSSFAISFQVINDCTNKGHPKLIDSRGFSSGIKLHRANATDWKPKVNVYIANWLLPNLTKFVQKENIFIGYLSLSHLRVQEVAFSI